MVIVVLDLNDLERIGNGTNLIQVLRERYEAVRLDLRGSGSANQRFRRTRSGGLGPLTRPAQLRH